MRPATHNKLAARAVVPGQPVGFRRKPAEEADCHQVGIRVRGGSLQLLVDHPDLMAGWRQGGQMDPGERRDKVFLMPKTVARDVRQYEVDLHFGGSLPKRFMQGYPLRTGEDPQRTRDDGQKVSESFRKGFTDTMAA